MFYRCLIKWRGLLEAIYLKSIYVQIIKWIIDSWVIIFTPN